MDDALRRGIRTFLQAFVGSLVLQLGTVVTSPGTLPDWNALKAVLIAAVLAGVIALLSYAQNALEDAGAVPAIMKAPASPGANPVPDPGAGNRVERHEGHEGHGEHGEHGDPSPGG